VAQFTYFKGSDVSEERRRVFAAWGRFVYKFRWAVLVLSLLSLAATVVLMVYGGRLGTEFSAEGETERADELLDGKLPQRAPSFTLIFGSDDLEVEGRAFRREMERALEPVRKDERVKDVLTAFDGGTVQKEMVSRDGDRALAVVEMKDAEYNELQSAYEGVREKARPDSLEVVATGEMPLNADFESVTEADLRRAETVSLPLALLLLLFVFGSVVAAGLPVGVGLLAVAGGMGCTLFLARYMDVSVYATNIVSMIGLGVAIDYSLFFVSRFREEVRRRPVPDALARTMATAGRAIVFSGLTVAIGLAGFLFFDLGDLRTMGLAGTFVVVLAVLYALTFLPALLAILGSRVNALRVPFVHPERDRAGRGLWHTVANAVMNRPWTALIPAVALLVILGTPFLGIRIGLSGWDSLPTDAESRRGQEILKKEFPGGTTNPTVVVVDYGDESALTQVHVGRLYELSRWISEKPGVEEVESAVDLDPTLSREEYEALLTRPRKDLPPELREALERSVGDGVAVLTAYTTYEYDTEKAHDLVREVREEHPPVGGEVLVTGFAAFDVDLAASVAEDAPKAIGFVVFATYVVLFLLLGSVFLPLKAIVMNFLSISASYGALVWVFQEGHLSGLLNFTPGPINTTTPIIMFCILFGLSMDYEVLLLSRVKEEYDRTGDNRASVAWGLERTGRLITGAALIMATVFFSFGLAEAIIIKAIGLGMGLAVIMDATIVRALLVPATMRIMGDWNWWAPKPLRRLHDRLGLQETSSEAELEPDRTEPAYETARDAT
jgi:putative drug exporter of the RND superfamily